MHSQPYAWFPLYLFLLDITDLENVFLVLPQLVGLHEYLSSRNSHICPETELADQASDRILPIVVWSSGVLCESFQYFFPKH